MCDPVSLAISATVVQGISTVSSHLSNADMLDAQARFRMQKAQADAMQAERRFHRVQGRAIANAAKSGFAMSSFDDFLHSNAIESAREIAAIYTTGKAESAMLKAQAKQERFGALTSAIGTGLSAWGYGLRYNTPSVTLNSPWETTTTIYR